MKKIPTLLQGEVCHLTTIDSFLKIHETGFILRRLDDSNVRHRKNGQNSKNSQQGYVQILGGISVFDLRNFDLNIYDQYIKSTWDVIFGELYSFIPIHQMNRIDGMAVWLLIDTNKCQKFIDKTMLYDRWLKRSSNENNSLYIPKVEAAILEDIPITWITKVIIYKAKNQQFLEMTIDEACKYFKDRVD